ncbi:MAG TPA: hypothetical protein VMH86_06430 [Rhizomicrobium sp.]|nr:hypothetical protein [Rhizomicrobium sp.]
MRAIVRFSLNGPQPAYAKLYAKLRRRLDKHGIKWTGGRTATYAAISLQESDIEIALNAFWKVLANNTSSAKLDHFWMYVERLPVKKAGRKTPKKKYP